MAEPGKLKLTLLDVQQQRLRQEVDVLLQHQTLRSADVRATLPAGKSAVITGLRAQPDGVYRLEADPRAYLPVAQFVVIGSTGTTTLDLTFPVDSHKIRSVVFPQHAEHLTALPRISLNGNFQRPRYAKVLISGAATGLWNGFRPVNVT